MSWFEIVTCPSCAVLPLSSVGEITLKLYSALTLIAKSSKHENAKQGDVPANVEFGVAAAPWPA